MITKKVLYKNHLQSIYSTWSALKPVPTTISLSSVCVLAILSIVGNLLVIVMAIKRSSRMKPPELLCVNLAVTDLGAAITMYPLAVASAWNHHWIGGDATCTYYGVVGFIFGITSIMSLAALAIVRFIVSLNLQSPREYPSDLFTS